MQRIITLVQLTQPKWNWVTQGDTIPTDLPYFSWQRNDHILCGVVYAERQEVCIITTDPNLTQYIYTILDKTFTYRIFLLNQSHPYCIFLCFDDVFFENLHLVCRDQIDVDQITNFWEPKFNFKKIQDCLRTMREGLKTLKYQIKEDAQVRFVGDNTPYSTLLFFQSPEKLDIHDDVQEDYRYGLTYNNRADLLWLALKNSDLLTSFRVLKTKSSTVDYTNDLSQLKKKWTPDHITFLRDRLKKHVEKQDLDYLGLPYQVFTEISELNTLDSPCVFSLITDTTLGSGIRLSKDIVIFHTQEKLDLSLNAYKFQVHIPPKFYLPFLLAYYIIPHLDSALHDDFSRAFNIPTPPEVNTISDIRTFWEQERANIRLPAQTILEILRGNRTRIKERIKSIYGDKIEWHILETTKPPQKPCFFTCLYPITSGVVTTQGTVFYLGHPTLFPLPGLLIPLRRISALAEALAFFAFPTLDLQVDTKSLTEIGQTLSETLTEIGQNLSDQNFTNEVPDTINHWHSQSYIINQFLQVHRLPRPSEPPVLDRSNSLDEANMAGQKLTNYITRMGHIITAHSIVMNTALRLTHPTFDFISAEAYQLKDRLKKLRQPVTRTTIFNIGYYIPGDENGHAVCAIIDPQHLIYINTGALYGIIEQSIINQLKKIAPQQVHIIIQNDIQRNYDSCLMWSTVLPWIWIRYPQKRTKFLNTIYQTSTDVAAFTALLTKVFTTIIKTIQSHKPKEATRFGLFSDWGIKAIAHQIDLFIPQIAHQFFQLRLRPKETQVQFQGRPRSRSLILGIITLNEAYSTTTWEQGQTLFTTWLQDLQQPNIIVFGHQETTGQLATLWLRWITDRGYTTILNTAHQALQLTIVARHHPVKILQETQTTNCSFLSRKGGLSTTLQISDLTIHITNAHLPFNGSDSKKQQGLPARLDCLRLLSQKHERRILLGDLNFRLNTSPTQAQKLSPQQLWHLDQLWPHLRSLGWHEGTPDAPGPTFPPTCKFAQQGYTTQVTRLSWCNGLEVQKRVPSWCDRILFSPNITALRYWASRPSTLKTDHAAVLGLLQCHP